MNFSVSLDSGKVNYFACLCFFAGSYALFTEPASTEKLGLTALFTHFKLFRYSVFSFQ